MNLNSPKRKPLTISACPAAHLLKWNPRKKKKLLFIPCDSFSRHRRDLMIFLDNSQDLTSYHCMPALCNHGQSTVTFFSDCPSDSLMFSPLQHQKDSSISLHPGHSGTRSVPCRFETRLQTPVHQRSRMHLYHSSSAPIPPPKRCWKTTTKCTALKSDCYLYTVLTEIYKI